MTSDEASALEHARDAYNATLREAAAFYVSLGWRVVPVRYREKAPSIGKEWPRQVRDTPPAKMLRRLRVPGNVGVVTGSLSADVVDVDLDCDEAVALAPLLLEPTWTFGRASKPNSHWIYTASGATYRKFAWRDGHALLELRGNNKPGAQGIQTVFPPSVHECGEAIAWTDDADTAGPLVTDAADLTRRVHILACAALVARCSTLEAARAWLGGAPAPPLCPPGCLHDVTTGPKACPNLLLREWMGAGNVFPKVPPKRVLSTEEATDLASAVDAFNRAAGAAFPEHNDECPVCGSPGGFKASGTPGRWVCHSARHQDVGVAGTNCWTGDALDLATHAAGGLTGRTHKARRIALLKRDGFLKGRG